MDISGYKKRIKASEFKTIQGQVDSFELFMELAIKIVKKGGYFGFIVPDSILNHGKSILRGILLKQTQIMFISRLGEKIFPKINRACVVIICKNSPPTKNTIVDCFRLSSKDRSKILEGHLSFEKAESSSFHKVPQERFRTNPTQRFDIDLKESETKLLKKFNKFNKKIKDALSSSRGVELGSSGLICRCPNCSAWSPLSKKEKIICRTCNQEFKTSEIKSIIHPKKISNSVMLINGHDLKRYVCKGSQWITLGVKGINYKPKTDYKGPKILVRKTGIGITAALDYSDVYTNQVVYILKNRNPQENNLEFFIGLINSRAYYFYLAKSFGELEWKSHPYLTQVQILNLPIPDINLEQNTKIIRAITTLLSPTLKEIGGITPEIDLKVELLIGKMLSLNKNDYKIIFNAIEDSDNLLPIRDLKKIKMADVVRKIK